MGKKSASESQAFTAFGQSLFTLTPVEKSRGLSVVVTGVEVTATSCSSSRGLSVVVTGVEVTATSCSSSRST